MSGFASANDLADKIVSFDELGPGLYGYTAEGDPNSGVVVGPDSVLVIDAQATPAMAADVIARIRTVTDKPVKHVVLSHYHAVRVLGASGYAGAEIIASDVTRDLIVERGQQDMDSEIGRFPRLFRGKDSIPGLTWPTLTFHKRMTLWMGHREVQIIHVGRSHTAGDTVVWLPQDRVLFAGDTVEYGATPYCGDAHFGDWAGTLAVVKALGAERLVPGRGRSLMTPAEVAEGIEGTASFTADLFAVAKHCVARGASLGETYAEAMSVMRPKYGKWVIFEHCMPFDVSRAYDEAGGLDHPQIWTAERDIAMWKALEHGHATDGGDRKVNVSTRIAGVTEAGYMSGFGNGFETEALPGALPIGRNSPQRCAYGLYAEQLSGSPFTAPRASNERSWLYRIRPTVKHWGRFDQADAGLWRTAPCTEWTMPIAPLRWDPVAIPAEPATFLQGVRTVTTCGDSDARTGMAAHLYLLNASMVDEYFYNADGELLFVPQQGRLRLWTEFGIIDAAPGEIAVIPRGVKLRVEVPDGTARGYLCENYGGGLTLPERGPIGANCLANPRDFLTPVASYEDHDGPCRMVVKWGGAFWSTKLEASPLDVVAWHGNYAPYKYDLRRFSPVGPLLFDHADPSIFTTLTAPSETPGTANIDFVVFPDRWAVAEDTFRPPWYHMNIMSEFMGLIYGVYDAKPQGFVPGGFSLHNSMLPHGPDAEAFEGASSADLAPKKLSGTMAFMFEARFAQRVTAWAAQLAELQTGYGDCWHGLVKRFDPTRP